MTASEIQKTLYGLRDRLRPMADGGDALVQGITDFVASSDPQMRGEIRKALVHLVGDPVARMRGASLDALVHMGEKDVCQGLTDLLRADDVPVELRDDIAKALLRLRCEAAVPECISVVTSGSERPSRPAVLAALAPVDEQAFRYLAADYVSSCDLTSGTPSWLPTFVYHIAQAGGGLLAAHVSDVRRIDEQQSRSYTQLLVDYLKRPWVPDEIGLDRHLALSSELDDVMAP